MQVSTHQALDSRRRGLAGVFAAVMIFAMLFTAGVGYYMYENQASTRNSEAQVNEEFANLQANQEQLDLAVSYVNPNLVLQAVNVGGVAATITAVFVTGESGVTGQMLSHDPETGSAYLVGPPDLNVSLPISLMVGANTSVTGSNIAIYSEAYKYTGAMVFVNVLTLRGNVFSIQFPLTLTATSSVTTTIASTSSLATSSTVTVTSAMNTSVTSWTTSVTTSGTVTGFVIGTNSLLVALEACPGPGNLYTGASFTTTCVQGATAVYSGGEVILEASVTNSAGITLSTDVVFESVVTGGTGASVTASSLAGSQYDCAGSPGTTPAQNIGAGSTVTFTCVFSASQGATAGMVTFVGYAVGSYTGPSGLITITSAEATSNELQLGNPASGITGPWTVNYYSFTYASIESTTFSPATIISHSGNAEVVFQVQVTNTANTSLTVLQYTYLQFLGFPKKWITTSSAL